MPSRNLPQEISNALVNWFAPRLADRFQEPGIAKRIAGVVHRLGDAVGVKVQAITGPQSDRQLMVRFFGQADRKPLALQNHRIGAAGHMHRAGMTSGDVAELPVRGVEDTIDHRSKLLCRQIEREQPVQMGDDFARRRNVKPIPDCWARVS